MKRLIFAAVLMVAVAGQAKADIYGTYKAGTRKPIIKVDMGNRGGDEFMSSACKGKIFSPEFHDDGTYTGPGYFIYVDDVGLTIEKDKNGNKCFPEGRYLKQK